MKLESFFQYTKKKSHITVLFSLLFTLLFIQGSHITFSGNIAGSLKKNYITAWTIKDLGIFLLFFVAIFVLLSLLNFIAGNFSVTKRNTLSDKATLVYVLILSAFLLLCWSPYLLSYYPGSVLADSLVSIRQALSERITSNHYPVVYSLFVGVFIKIGLFLGNINTGVFLYSLCQSFLMAATLSFTLVWLYRKGVNKIILLIFFLFYGIMPFFPTYAIILWKDPIYSCALLLLMLLLFEVAASKGTILASNRVIGAFVFLFAVISFFRNNGIYTAILCSLILFFYYRKQMLRAFVVFLCFMGIYFAITGPLYTKLGIESEFVESLGIPLQQLGYTIANDGKLTPSEEEFLFTLLPEKHWKKNYRPCIVDTIKWDSEFNASYLEENKLTFIKVWASVLTRNFGNYINAYCLETFGFWKPLVQNSYGYVDTYISDNELSIVPTDMFARIFGISIQENLASFRPMMGSGTLLWCFLVCSYLCIMQDKKSWFILVPAFANWLVILLATPVAFSLRYVYIFALGLPLGICLPFIIGEKEEGVSRS